MAGLSWQALRQELFLAVASSYNTELLAPPSHTHQGIQQWRECCKPSRITRLVQSSQPASHLP
jgi:hypothetical protein